MNGQKSDFGKYMLMLMLVVMLIGVASVALPSMIGGAVDAAQTPGVALCTELTMCDN